MLSYKKVHRKSLMEFVYKNKVRAGFGNIIIILADIQDRCKLLHDDVYDWELSNCVTLEGFTRVSLVDNPDPGGHIIITPQTSQFIHPRIRDIVQPTPHLAKMIDDHSHLLDGVSACVHIRRGAYSKDSLQRKIENLDKWHYFCTDEALEIFEKAIENEPGKVYVASDSNEVKERLIVKFGDKLRMIQTQYAATAPQDGTDTQNQKTLQDVYLEWFLMSKCPKLYLTGGRTDFVGFSTYGYTAAIYGSKPFCIIFNP